MIFLAFNISEDSNLMTHAYFDESSGSLSFRLAAGYLPSLIVKFFVGILVWYIVFEINNIIVNDRDSFWRRSWLYRLFLYIKKKKNDYFYEVSHIDLSGDLRKAVKKFVIINAVIMGFCCAAWFFGWVGLVIYSLILFSTLLKFLEKIREQYRMLLSVTSQMAEGQIDAVLPDDLGVYESFRPSVLKIQEGIREAVRKEVSSERMRMELVSNVSHDIKTPLTAIITYVDLLRDEKLSPEKRAEYLDILNVRSDRLKHLIEDLFEVTKATTGNIKFEPVQMDIVNLVKQVAVEYEYRFNEANLELIYDLPEGKIPIFADSQKTYRIYANLFGNVAKYSLKNTRVYVQITESDTDVMVVVRNISARRISQKETELVERFVRGDKARNTEGSGLGLAIAKSFTELQGGTFDIIVDGDLFKAITVWKKKK
jgi:signal transduction histidine kinase